MEGTLFNKASRYLDKIAKIILIKIDQNYHRVKLGHLKINLGRIINRKENGL